MPQIRFPRERCRPINQRGLVVAGDLVKSGNAPVAALEHLTRCFCKPRFIPIDERESLVLDAQQRADEQSNEEERADFDAAVLHKSNNETVCRIVVGRGTTAMGRAIEEIPLRLLSTRVI